MSIAKKKIVCVKMYNINLFFVKINIYLFIGRGLIFLPKC